MTMRNRFLITAALATTGMFTGLALAQTSPSSDKTIPDAPQPQKKSAPKAAASKAAESNPKEATQPGDSAPPPAVEDAPTPPASKEDNAFPEDVSKAAAHNPPKAPSSSSSSATPDAEQEAKPAARDDNAFPDDVSRAAARTAGGSSSSSASSSSATPDSQQEAKPAKNENAFPEKVSRQAAKAKDAQDQPPPTAPQSDLPPGVSSSQSSSSLDTVEAPAGPDPARAKKDEDVGSYYLKKGDYAGALARYKDAGAADPTDVEAMFGMAETQRMLRNNTEAIRYYQMYLAVVPDGPRARQAIKALKLIQPTH